jgi:hypothetical protein
VLGAVDLNELADAIAAMSGLVDRLETLPAVFPKPFGQHPAPNGFDAQTQPVTLSQLLGRQRRAKIRVIRLDQRERFGSHDRRIGPVARLAASLRQQRRGPIGPINLQQPKHLARRHAHQLRGFPSRNPLPKHISQNM